MVDLPVRKQFPYSLEGHAADIGVAGVVVDKVIPEDPAPGLHQRPHPFGQFLLEAVVKNRSKYSELINNIKRSFVKIDLSRIPQILALG